jgi:hypothetical protein
MFEQEGRRKNASLGLTAVPDLLNGRAGLWRFPRPSTGRLRRASQTGILLAQRSYLFPRVVIYSPREVSGASYLLQNGKAQKKVSILAPVLPACPPKS